MRRHYSRLAKSEESRNIRTAYLYIAFSIATLVALVFLGIPAISKILGIIGGFKGDAPIILKDTTPPAPPRIEDPPEATNKSNLEISGTTEPGITVLITLNSKTTEVVADANGNFTSKLALLAGENVLFLQAKDNSGNESGKTPTYKIIQDSTAPKLTEIQPADGTHFSGSQKQITIEGKTDPEAIVLINDKRVAVDENGKFTYSTSLTEGENTFAIKATDKAQNTTQITLRLSYSQQ